MIKDNSDIGLIILSLFCAGGLYAYLRETLRLRRLMSSGMVAPASVLKKEKIDSGSESVVHFLVTYEFVDDEGNPVVHQQDLNSRKFFDNLAVGDQLEILYQKDSIENSYPLSQVQRDKDIAKWISAAILVFWGVMGVLIK